MKTSSFFSPSLPSEGRISIARFAPRRHPKGYRVYSRLAPGKWFNSVNEAMYRKLFAEQLLGRDPQATWDELRSLAGGAEPILLCWEEPGVFCHRRLVAIWFEEHLGVTVPEMDPAAPLLVQPPTLFSTDFI